MDLSYILKKITDAHLLTEPFEHLEIENVFEEEEFRQIVNSPEVRLEPATSDKQLFDNMFSRGYKVVEFPGCTTDYREYLEWHKRKLHSTKSNTACEGFGVVLRLETPESECLKSLHEFLVSDAMKKVIAEKFNIDANDCIYDAGIQKYLDGYEISPHPDIRRKAATFMVNVNSSSNSESDDHHTSFLRFKPEWRYIEEFWKSNPSVDRCWVPWDWCVSVKKQTKNNSMVIFAPSHDTLHAVKANYNHLNSQRTQLYGNVWFEHCPATTRLKWEDLVVTSTLDKVEKHPSRIMRKLQRVFSRKALADSRSSSRDGLNALN